MPDKLNKKLSIEQHKLAIFDGSQATTSFSTLLYPTIALIFSLGYQGLARAQISSDGTVSTEVNNSGIVTEITGGTTEGTNLFHSFQEFSVPTDNTAYFNNSNEINNIVGRVTGNSISNINGLLRANGNANLILINPNGIDFGANARLQIGGSFLGSTAESLIFEDGTIFSANDLTSSPLLTISTPFGLQLGQSSGAINVRGAGHNIGIDIPIFSPFNRTEVSGLQMQSGDTFGLVGGEISLEGGVIASEQGRVELGSVFEGTVSLNWNEGNFSLDYQEIEVFQNIDLQDSSLIDASGNNGGSIAIYGNEIEISDGSLVLIQNTGDAASGNLVVNAATSFSTSGMGEDGIVSSGIYTEALGGGKGGNITVSTSNLTVSDGAKIFTDSFSPAMAGDINLDVVDSVEIIGFAPIDPSQFSLISTQAFNRGNAGVININTANLIALDGGNVASVTGSPDGTGSGGDVRINASESILLSGINPVAFAPSQITAGSGSAGSAGNVELNTKNLTLQNGGRVDASATATGNGGNININASESIVVTGRVPNSRNPSLITTSANILDPQLRQQLNLPDVPSGNAGNISIETSQLQVKDGGQITVRNDGTGDAGNLSIAADTLALSNEGGITAAVEKGIGGTINLEVADSIRLTSGSQISSDNNGAGDGGEITIASNSLLISDRAFITTTTFGSGKGGNIQLDILGNVDITGIGFEEFQQTFQANSLNGSLMAGTRGTGIFIGTAADGIGGNLEINTTTLNLSEGGIIFAPIFADGAGGNISIDAKNINISASALQVSSGVDSTSMAASGDIFISADNLTIVDGGTIVNATFGEATGGNINVDVSESVSLQNTPDGSRLFSGIYANTSIGNGRGGDITLSADSLSIEDAFVSSTTGGFINDNGSLIFDGGGDGGNIYIDVQSNINISGIPTDPRFASGINSNSFTNGNAGNIDISTNNLSIIDGSEIAATTVGSGNGGSININATDSITLFGTTTINNMQRGGAIATSGRAAFPDSIASGASGNITINTGNLTIEEGASIDVQSLGMGSAGNLEIESSGDILLDNGGTISAANNLGDGGNISILADNIFWRGNSTTTATATSDANGGNISIVGTNLVVSESSQLVAEAERGKGGSIDIDAEGLFVCQECIVSASSRLGVDGIVEINTLEPEPVFGVVEVPIQLTQPEETVAQACSNSPNGNNSKLIITGRGGLPPSPNETLNSKSIVSFGIPQKNVQSLEATSKQKSVLPSPAHSWYQNSQGEIILSAQPSAGIPQFNPDCHAR